MYVSCILSPTCYVCQIKFKKRSARLIMVIEPPLVRRLWIRGHSTFQADFIIKISSNVLRRHFKHGRIYKDKNVFNIPRN